MYTTFSTFPFHRFFSFFRSSTVLSMGKNKNKRRSLNAFSPCDVTLNDSADSRNPVQRLKKHTMTALQAEVKQLSITKGTWDQKVEVLAPEIEDHLPVARCEPQAQSKKEDENSEEFKIYPMIVWISIADFIAPEDVKVFSSICRDTYRATNRAGFWFSLYKRYYKADSSVPLNLRPECIKRRYGLRAQVIRALYYTYPPFIINYSRNPSAMPEGLFKRICTISSVTEVKENRWKYRFTLRRESMCNRGRRAVQQKPTLDEILDDIHANPDSECKCFQVLADSFTPLPMVNGYRLMNFNMVLTRSLDANNMTLQFQNGPSAYQTCVLVLNKVVGYNILDWWHPSFPRSSMDIPRI